MTFIITLVALLLERFFHWRHLRDWRWFLRYERWLNIQMGQQSGAVKLLATILPSLIIVGLISYLLSGWFYGMLTLIYGVVVLLYCLGSENLWVQVYRCLNELRGENPTAAVDRMVSLFGMVPPANSQAFHQAFVRAIFVTANERIFAVLFWFVILGPVGAVLYRLIEIFNSRPELGLTPLTGKIKRVLDWIPIRLFTFLFALGGHFTEVLVFWKKNVFEGLSANEVLLTDCGTAALDVAEVQQFPETGEAEKEALALIDRVLVMALVILAIIVLLI